jgi:hypothetical protein
MTGAFSMTSLLRRAHSAASAVRDNEERRGFNSHNTLWLSNDPILIAKPPEPAPSPKKTFFGGAPKFRYKI